jgi:dTMP kinase
MHGNFISFEGIDGAGKSSHIAAVAEHIRAAGITVLTTREPGGTPLSEKLRSLILNDGMDELTEALLAFAARRDHLKEVICPALARGEVVLCDRFTDSTIAYQGFGRQMPNGEEILSTLERWVQRDRDTGKLVEPELTLWFDLDPAIAAERLKDARTPDRFESQASSFFNRVRQGYQSRMKQNPDRFVRLEANLPSEVVRENVMKAIDGYFHQLVQRDVEKLRAQRQSQTTPS